MSFFASARREARVPRIADMLLCAIQTTTAHLITGTSSSFQPPDYYHAVAMSKYNGSVRITLNVLNRAGGRMCCQRARPTLLDGTNGGLAGDGPHEGD